MRTTRITSFRPRSCSARVVLLLAAAAAAAALGSCAKPPIPTEPRQPREIAAPDYLKDTVGEVARLSGREPVPVQGYGFVTGLDGTGTKVVPPGVRQQILDIMRRRKVEKPEEILTNPDNAVVTVVGYLTPGIAKGERFDLEVRTVPNTETTSLEGGFLLEGDLTRVVSARGVETRGESLALGRGSVFVSPFGGKDGKATGDPRVGRILGGGKAIKTRHFKLVLLSPSVRTADQIVRLVNARFPGAAKSTQDPGQIDLAVPRDFESDKPHFLDLVGALYMRETSDVRDQRIAMLIDALRTGKDLDTVSTCLESFGSAVVPRLYPLADEPGESVRFYVGRTLARLQDARAVSVLERIVKDNASEFQESAVVALGQLRTGLGLGLLNRALNAPSARVRVAAWLASERLAPGTFGAQTFPDKFTLSLVPTTAEPFVYIARTLRPRIAIFGDVKVRPPVLAETHRVTANAVADAQKVQLTSRRRGETLRAESTLDLKAVIARIARPIVTKGATEAQLDAVDTANLPGLDLGYSDVVGLVNEFSRKNALTGSLMLEPLQYQIGGDRPTARPISDAPPSPQS